MKLVYTMLFAILLVVPACNRSDTERVRAAPDERATVDAQKDQRDAYVKSLEAKLDEFDEKLDGLDQRAQAMTGTAKANFTDSVRRLRDQRQMVTKKLDDLKSVNIESWSTLKAEVDAAVADLERSYEQVSAINDTTPAAPKTQRK